MAVPRYYRVLRGQRGPAARQKYLDYLAGLAQPDLTNETPKNRPASKVLYVKPFGVDLGADALLQTSALDPSFTKLRAAVGATRVFDVLAAGKSAIKIRNAKAARVSATDGLSTTGTYQKSNATGLWYVDYGGNSYSCPFGASTSTEKEGEAFTSIKTALGVAYKRVHLIEERI
jgi:hypothetical protein